MSNEMIQPEFMFITHEVENAIINQRAVDGFINATAMCKAVGKSLFDAEFLKWRGK